MQAEKLKLGDVYFVLVYEDENHARFMIQSHEYLGKHGSDDESGASIYLFRLLGSDGELELKENDLDLMLDVKGLIDSLKQEPSGMSTP